MEFSGISDNNLILKIRNKEVILEILHTIYLKPISYIHIACHQFCVFLYAFFTAFLYDQYCQPLYISD